MTLAVIFSTRYHVGDGYISFYDRCIPTLVLCGRNSFALVAIPSPASEEYRGSKIAFYFLILVAVVSTIRSFMHIFAADGGANSIAGLAVNIEGGIIIVAIFAQLGAIQLILAVFYWLTILRYRFLVPFMLPVVFLEQSLRIAVGQLKPIEVAVHPQGRLGATFFSRYLCSLLFCPCARGL
jgi:hypothetical protein